MKLLKIAALAFLTSTPAFAGVISPVPPNKELPDWRGAGANVWCLDSQSLDNLLDNLPDFIVIYQETARFVAPGCALIPGGMPFTSEPVAEYLYTTDYGSTFVAISMSGNGETVWTYGEEQILQDKETY